MEIIDEGIENQKENIKYMSERITTEDDKNIRLCLEEMQRIHFLLLNQWKNLDAWNNQMLKGL